MNEKITLRDDAMSEDEYTTTFIHEEREERFKIRFIPEVECGTNRWIRLNNGVPILSNTANIFTLIDPSTNEPVNILLILSHKESVHKQTRHTKIVKQIQEIQDSKNHEEKEFINDKIDPYFTKVASILARYHDCLIELSMYHHGEHHIDFEYFDAAKQECLTEFKELTGKDIKDL